MSSGAIGVIVFLFFALVAMAFMLAFAAAYRGCWLQWLLVSRRLRLARLGRLRHQR